MRKCIAGLVGEDKTQCLKTRADTVTAVRSTLQWPLGPICSNEIWPTIGGCTRSDTVVATCQTAVTPALTFFLLHLTRHSPSPMSEIQANFTVPQLIAVLVIGFLVVRWIFFSSSAASQTSGSHAAGRSRVSPAQVDQVAQMFPQFSAREIMWDLQRNGGSVQATTERVLSGRGLDTVSTSANPKKIRRCHRGPPFCRFL